MTQIATATLAMTRLATLAMTSFATFAKTNMKMGKTGSVEAEFWAQEGTKKPPEHWLQTVAAGGKPKKVTRSGASA